MSFKIDLTEVKDSGFRLLPNGKYHVIVEEAEVRTTKDGTGEYINVQFEVREAGYNGKKLFTMFNIKNNNAKAVEIGMQQLKNLITSSGKKELVLTSVSSLLGLQAIAVVKSKTDSFGDKNIISYYEAIGSSTGPTPSYVGSDIPF